MRWCFHFVLLLAIVSCVPNRSDDFLSFDEVQLPDPVDDDPGGGDVPGPDPDGGGGDDPPDEEEEEEIVEVVGPCTNRTGAVAGIQYQFFTGSLKAVDPATPDAVEVITEDDVRPSSAVPLLSAEFVPPSEPNGSPIVRAIQPTEILYAVGDALLWADANIGPEEVLEGLNLTDGFGGDIRTIFIANDFSDACLTQLVLHLDGDIYRTVLLDTTVRPFPAKPLASLNDVNTGAFTGWLAHSEETGELLRVDALGTETSLGMFEEVEFLHDSSVGGSFLRIDGFLWFFNGTTDELTDLGVDFTGFDDFVTAIDVDSLLLLGADGTAITLDRISPSGELTSVYSAVDGSFFLPPFLRLGRSADRIVFTYTAGFVTRLQSVPADGTEDLVIIDTAITEILVTEDRVFYTAAIPGGGIEAVVSDPVGEELFRETTARWTGFQVDELGLGTVAPTKIFLVRGLDPEALTAGGGTLVAFDPSTSSETVNLGEIPDVVDELTVPVYPAVADATLVRSVEVEGETTNEDVFFVDAARESSLQRVTDTLDENELPVFWARNLAALRGMVL